jgi:hypothetical protein
MGARAVARYIGRSIIGAGRVLGVALLLWVATGASNVHPAGFVQSNGGGLCWTAPDGSPAYCAWPVGTVLTYGPAVKGR